MSKPSNATVRGSLEIRTLLVEQIKISLEGHKASEGQLKMSLKHLVRTFSLCTLATAELPFDWTFEDATDGQPFCGQVVLLTDPFSADKLTSSRYIFLP